MRIGARVDMWGAFDAVPSYLRMRATAVGIILAERAQALAGVMRPLAELA